MQFTVIGNSGPYPELGDVCSGYMVEADGRKILLDCGSGVLQAMQKYCSLEELDSVILSHLHSDHMSDMLVMRYAMKFSGRQAKLPVFMPAEPEAEAWLLNGCKEFAVSTIQYNNLYQTGNIKIYFMPVRHPILAYAVRLEFEGKTIVYSGDTMFDENLIDFATNADLFVCDSTFLQSQLWEGAPHASALQAATMAKRAKVKRLLLTHFSPKADKLALLSEAKAIFKNCILSEKGQSIQV